MLRFVVTMLVFVLTLPAVAADLTAESLVEGYARRNEAGELATPRQPLSLSHDCQRLTWSPRDGAVIEYDDCTPKAGPAVAVVLWHHGGPGEGINRGYYAWSRASLRHIQINQPGIGRSTGGPGWSPEQTVDDEAALLTHLSVSDPVIVGGWSWGSTMSLLFAQRHPQRVKAVIVGGIWSNSRADVGWYMGPRGARQYLPAWRPADSTTLSDAAGAPAVSETPSRRSLPLLRSTSGGRLSRRIRWPPAIGPRARGPTPASWLLPGLRAI